MHSAWRTILALLGVGRSGVDQVRRTQLAAGMGGMPSRTHTPGLTWSAARVQDPAASAQQQLRRPAAVRRRDTPPAAAAGPPRSRRARCHVASSSAVPLDCGGRRQGRTPGSIPAGPVGGKPTERLFRTKSLRVAAHLRVQSPLSACTGTGNAGVVSATPEVVLVLATAPADP